MLPLSVRDYVLCEARRINVPIDAIGCSVMVTIGAGIGNKIGVNPKPSDSTYIEYPNNYGMIIGNASFRKSSSLDSAVFPLEKIDNELKELGSGQRILVHDATPEKLLQIARDNPKGLMIYNDELAGLLCNMKKSGRELERALFLTGWYGCKSFGQERLSRSCFTPCLCLSVMGTIQPKILTQVFELSEIGDGLLQRFNLAVFPDPIDVECSDLGTPDYLKENYEELIRNLVRYEPKDEESTILKFSQGAFEAYSRWEVELRQETGDESFPEHLGSHLSKYPTLLTTLALIFHLLDNETRVEGDIQLDSWNKAQKWYPFLRSHAERIYDVADKSDIRQAKLLVEKIQEGKLHGTIKLSEIIRKGWRGLKDRKQVLAALRLMEEYNWVVVQEAETPGQKSWDVFINPKALTMS